MMLKHLIVLVTVTMLFILPATAVRAEDPPGAKPYNTFCAACHGAQGKGGFAPAIGDAKYLSAKDDAAITQAIAQGIPSKGMPAWSKGNGGSLADDQIKDIVAYLRSFDPSANQSNSVPPPTAPEIATTAQVAIQTKLTLTQSVNRDAETVLHATLKDDRGYPVSGATVTFRRATMWGTVELGTAKTDAAGNASLVIPEVPREGRQVVATFKGQKDLNPSEANINLEPVVASAGSLDSSKVHLSIETEPLLPPEGSLITPNPPLVPATIFLLVVGGVWTAYVYVMSQIVGIWKLRQPEAKQNTLRYSR